MDRRRKLYSSGFFLLLLTFFQYLAGTCCNADESTYTYGLGINYGLLGDNLPPPIRVVGLLETINVQYVRLFNPNHEVLDAIAGTGLQVIVGVPNESIVAMANDQSVATTWVQTNIVPYIPRVIFRVIAVGNEIAMPSEIAASLLPAMRNLKAAVGAIVNIPISTVINSATLVNTYPPSAATWSEGAAQYMPAIAEFLQSNGYPMLANAYPYFAYAANPADVKLDYALGNSDDVAVLDGMFKYTNLLDAIVDGFYAALHKSGTSNVEVYVTETGWPSAGGNAATIENARIYNNNVVRLRKRVTGTPRRPDVALQTILFSMFNEDQKPEGVERNWGLFNPDLTPVYNIDF